MDAPEIHVHKPHCDAGRIRNFLRGSSSHQKFNQGMLEGRPTHQLMRVHTRKGKHAGLSFTFPPFWMYSCRNGTTNSNASFLPPKIDDKKLYNMLHDTNSTQRRCIERGGQLEKPTHSRSDSGNNLRKIPYKATPSEKWIIA